MSEEKERRLITVAIHSKCSVYPLPEDISKKETGSSLIFSMNVDCPFPYLEDQYKKLIETQPEGSATITALTLWCPLSSGGLNGAFQEGPTSRFGEYELLPRIIFTDGGMQFLVETQDATIFEGNCSGVVEDFLGWIKSVLDANKRSLQVVARIRVGLKKLIQQLREPGTFADGNNGSMIRYALTIDEEDDELIKQYLDEDILWFSSLTPAKERMAGTAG